MQLWLNVNHKHTTLVTRTGFSLVYERHGNTKFQVWGIFALRLQRCYYIGSASFEKMEKSVQKLYSRKRNYLLTTRIEVQVLFKTLQDPGAAEGGNDRADKYQIVLWTLDWHFSMQLNEPCERHIFWSLSQEEGETVDQFITRLRKQAENCN